MNEDAYIEADWPAPPGVRAVVTLRHGGVSRPPYDSLNLGDHVGDDPVAVAHNRAHLGELLGLGSPPVWLQQVHGTRVVDAARVAAGTEADGSYATQAGAVCAVLTADCLPVFLCDRAATRVAVLHAGWRGLAAGVIEQGVGALGVAGGQLLAWLGPAIGPATFEGGAEVRDEFVRHDGQAAIAFRHGVAGKYLADIHALARLRLAALGVDAVYGGRFCTMSEGERFFSYRRDGRCGRMASLIWLETKA